MGEGEQTGAPSGTGSRADAPSPSVSASGFDPSRIAELEAENARLRTVTPAMLAAAWAVWKPRHKDRIGPGPAFKEALEAAIKEASR